MRFFTKRVFFAFILIVLMLSIGTVYYSYAEGWSPVDAFYFSTMTLTTIGYGDLAPTTEGAKIFTSFYAIFGIGIMLYILSSVIGVLVFKQEGRVSRAFSFIGRIRRHEKHINEIEKEQQKELMDLRKRLEKRPKIRKMVKEQQKELMELRERLEKRPKIRKMVRKQQKEIATIKKKISRK